jgi:hypothetical protein
MQSAAVELETQNRMFGIGVQVAYSNKLDWSPRLQWRMNQCSQDGPLAKAFFTALLLTRSAERAETAVLESINRLNSYEPFDEPILRGAIHASVTDNGIEPVSQEELEAALAALPLELHGILGFSPVLRRCFVLRILLQLPAQTCSRMLNLSADEVDQYTCEAVWSLPAHQAHTSHLAGRAILLKKREF